MGKKQAGTVRITISIPKRLRKAMDAVAQPVNWSRAAAQGIEQKLAEIAARKERKTMDDVIQRLRGSKLNRQTASALYQEGHRCGRYWAANDAEYDGLESLERFADSFPSEEEWEESFKPKPNEYYAPCAFLAMQLHPDWEAVQDWSLAYDWWKEIGDPNQDRRHEPDFLRGFAEGALHLWEEVRDSI